MANLDGKHKNIFVLGTTTTIPGDSDQGAIIYQKIDTQGMSAVTMTLTLDTRELTILPATFHVTAVEFLESDDEAFTVSDVIPADRIIGDLNDLIYTGDAGVELHNSVGTFNNKRYIRINATLVSPGEVGETAKSFISYSYEFEPQATNDEPPVYIS